MADCNPSTLPVQPSLGLIDKRRRFFATESILTFQPANHRSTMLLKRVVSGQIRLAGWLSCRARRRL